MQIAHFAQRSTSAIYLKKTKHHSTCCSLENLNESRAVESIVSLQLGFNIDLLVNNISTFRQPLKSLILKVFLTPTLYPKKIINLPYFHSV